MKAIVLERYGKATQSFAIKDIPTPELKGGQILIKSEAFGLNYADVMARLGMYKDAPPLPAVLGYEVVGTIEKTADSNKNNLVGKRVVAFTRFGGYAEYAVTDLRAAVVIDNMDAGTALALATQYSTALHCIQKACLQPGARVLVHAAAGGVGTALIQLLKLNHCEIYGTAGSEEKVQLAQQQGALKVVNYRTTDYVAELQKTIGHKGCMDATFNAVGGKTFKKDRKLLANCGTIVSFGAASRTGSKGGFFADLRLLFAMGWLHPLFLMMKSQTIAGVNMLRIADFQPELLQLYLNTAVKLTREKKISPIVREKFKVSEIAEAHARLESRKSTGKIVVYW